MESSSSGSFVFVAYSKDARTAGLLGVIFTQIIGSVDDIDLITSVDESDNSRNPNGRILQLLRVNTLVESGGVSTHIGVGVALRDFALALADNLGLDQVCAVTRCTSYRGEGADFQDYVSSVSGKGPTLDAGLGFHLNRGANILKCVSGWRPGDTANHGYGVLVLYDLAMLATSKVKYSMIVFVRLYSIMMFPTSTSFLFGALNSLLAKVKLPEPQEVWLISKQKYISWFG